MKWGVIQFPGSNCDHDCLTVVSGLAGCEGRLIWHKETTLGGVDAVVLPGGFSYGDYLRCGAIAKQSPIMQEVIKFAAKGGTVIGICNGFQILTEAGLLPGALMRNRSLTFICDRVSLTVENTKTRFTRGYAELGERPVITMPIAHAEGNYFCDDATLARLQDNGQIMFRYSDANGNVSDATNPNGARDNIAGIMNKTGNVLGMMPHPERVCDAGIGGVSGMALFESVVMS